MSSKKTSMRNVFALVFGMVVAIFVFPARSGESSDIALFPLENRAQLSQDEVATLSNAVSARFLEKAGADGVIVVADGGDVCDEFCARTKAMEAGAGVAVTGVVKTFGGAFMVELVATETGTGKLIGRGNTSPVTSLVELLPATEDLAEKFFDRLSDLAGSGGVTKMNPTPTKIYPDKTKSVPVPDQDTTGGMGEYGSIGYSDNAVIHVTSEPSGAVVRIGGVFSGPVAGKTPLSKALSPGIYTIEVEKKDYSRKKTRLRLHVGENKDLHFKLKPYVTLLALGHVAFWFGLPLEFAGLIMYASADEFSSLSTTMCVSGGILLATAATLWIVRGVKSARRDKKRSKIERGLTILPSDNQRVAVAYAQTF